MKCFGGLPNTTSFLIAKLCLILRSIDEQPGTLFAYADADIQFFPEAVVDNMQWIAESERDRYSLWCQQDNLGVPPCAGLFVCRGCEVIWVDACAGSCNS